MFCLALKGGPAHQGELVVADPGIRALCNLVKHDIAWQNTPRHGRPWRILAYHKIITYHSTTYHDASGMSSHIRSQHATSKVNDTRIMRIIDEAMTCVSCHILSHHLASSHVTSRHIISCHLTSRRASSRHVTSRHVKK